MEGIENIKTVVGFVLDGVSDAKKAMEDHVFNLKDSFLFVDNVIAIPKAIHAAARFWVEFQDLSQEEENEIVLFVTDRLQCDSDKAKRIIVQSFKVAMSIADTVKDGIELASIIKAA